jgi:phenylacetate-CoA ligase
MCIGDKMESVSENLLKLSFDKIEEYQLKMLKWTIKQAKKAKYYQDKISGMEIKSLSDISKFPFLSKQELRDNSPFNLIAVNKTELSHYIESFGTTGSPTSSWLTEFDFNNYANQINQAAVDFCPDDVVLIRFPYAFSSPAHIVQRAAKSKGACVVTASSRTLVSPHTRVINVMKKLDVSVVGCLPLEVIMLAETAKLMGYDTKKDFKHLRAFCVAGELLTEKRKRWLENMWDVKVYNLYGSTETGNLAATCKNGNLHLSNDHFLFEVLDENTKKPLKMGEKGILAVTTLTRQAMPLIRYIVGDLAELIDGTTCGCGINSQILKLYGRKSDVIEWNDEVLTLEEAEDLVLDLPWDILSNLWMIIVKDEGIVFKIEGQGNNIKIPDEWYEAANKITKIPCKIEIVEEGSLFNRENLLKVDPVIKPKYIADWRGDNNKLSSLNELLSGYHTFVKK